MPIDRATMVEVFTNERSRLEAANAAAELKAGLAKGRPEYILTQLRDLADVINLLIKPSKGTTWKAVVKTKAGVGRNVETLHDLFFENGNGHPRVQLKIDGTPSVTFFGPNGQIRTLPLSDQSPGLTDDQVITIMKDFSTALLINKIPTLDPDALKKG